MRMECDSVLVKQHLFERQSGCAIIDCMEIPNYVS